LNDFTYLNKPDKWAKNSRVVMNNTDTYFKGFIQCKATDVQNMQPYMSFSAACKIITK